MEILGVTLYTTGPAEEGVQVLVKDRLQDFRMSVDWDKIAHSDVLQAKLPPAFYAMVRELAQTGTLQEIELDPTGVRVKSTVILFITAEDSSKTATERLEAMTRAAEKVSGIRNPRREPKNEGAQLDAIIARWRNICNQLTS